MLTKRLQPLIALNVIVYDSLIDPQARAGRAEEGAVLFEGMKTEGLTEDAITCSTVEKPTAPSNCFSTSAPYVRNTCHGF